MVIYTLPKLYMPVSVELDFQPNPQEDFDSLTVVKISPVEPLKIVIEDTIVVLLELVNMNTIKGGRLIKINGEQPLPLGYALAAFFKTLYRATAVFDRKLNKFVVTHSTDPSLILGQDLS